MKVLPDGYYKSIFDIDYKSLKKNNIKNLVFDMDDTLISTKDKQINKKTLDFIKKLKKDFNIIIMTNNRGKKINYIRDKLQVTCYTLSFKPFKRNYKKLSKKISVEESVFIGDQISTDIWGATRNNFNCILVDSISKRKSIIYKSLEKFIKDKNFEYNKYYEFKEKKNG